MKRPIRGSFGERVRKMSPEELEALERKMASNLAAGIAAAKFGREASDKEFDRLFPGVRQRKPQ